MSTEVSNSELDPHNYPGIYLFSQPGSRILHKKDEGLEHKQAVFNAEYWQQRNAITGSASGRGKTLFIQHNNAELILRPYLRGGLPGKILTNQFFFAGFEKTRAWREFLLLCDMRKLGLPAPEPVAAGITQSGLIYRNNIIIKRIPGAKDLHQLLCREVLSPESWRDVGATIARFHGQQIYHHDLNIRNIMLDDNGQTWLIDFDRCAIMQGENWKQQNLSRLRRSLIKEQNKNPVFHWTEQDWQALLRGYQQN